MKYLKTYESKEETNKYNVNDYILLENENDHWLVSTVAKIVDFSNVPYYNTELGNTNRYLLESFNLEDKSIQNFWANEDEIIRKATPEEINNFEIEISSNKYNL